MAILPQPPVTVFLFGAVGLHSTIQSDLIIRAFKIFQVDPADARRHLEAGPYCRPLLSVIPWFQKARRSWCSWHTVFPSVRLVGLPVCLFVDWFVGWANTLTCLSFQLLLRSSCTSLFACSLQGNFVQGWSRFGSPSLEVRSRNQVA